MMHFFSKFQFIYALCIGAIILTSSCKKDSKDTPAPTANTVALRAVDLSGDNEVPSVATTATGTFSGSYNKDTKKITYTLTYTDVTPIAMHFHTAEIGKSGPVAIALTTPTSSPFTETSPALTSAQEADLLAGKFYINVHSSANPGGEIRAQVLTNDMELYTDIELNGIKEVPSVTTNSSGTFDGLYNKATKVLTYTINLSNLTTVTAMHIHKGAVGVSGPVEIVLTTPTSNTLTESKTLTDAEATDLAAGNFYVNVHTAANANGEIRGQLTSENMEEFTVSMSGAEENPSVATTSTGTFYSLYNGTTKVLTYTAAFKGTNTPTAMHIHKGALGSNGSVIFPLVTPSGTSPNFTSTGSTTPFSTSNEQDLAAGNYYVNIHTAANGNGEIRGQLE